MKKYSFSPNLYKKISLQNLILFSIFLLWQEGKETNFENLTEKCFTSFPQSFALTNYPQWPDTRKLDRPLRSLRKEDLIKGNPKSSFSLTRKGKKLALELARYFKQGKLL